MSGNVKKGVRPLSLRSARDSIATPGLEFASGNQLDRPSADLILANMIGRFLDDGDLWILHRMVVKKKPPAPSVRRPTACKRRVANHDPP
jgi:hypothetical protein